MPSLTLTQAVTQYETAVLALDTHTGRCPRCGFISAMQPDFDDCAVGGLLERAVLEAYDTQQALLDGQA